MGFGSGTRRVIALAVMVAGLGMVAIWPGTGAVAQTSVALTEPSAPLLPERFGDWKKAVANGETPSYSLVTVNKDALEECGPQRSQVAEYTRGGRNLHIEAIQFGDRTGAYSAFTLVERPGMTVGKTLGTDDAVGVAPNSAGAVLFTMGSSLVLANFGTAVTAADVASLKPLAEMLPIPPGNRGVAPLLPTLIPAKGLVEGSVRYALGPVSYAAEGGVLPPVSLSWDKEPEAVTALYDDARGKETLTVLLYPTPTIAENLAKSIRGVISHMGAALGTATLRREGLLVMVASGSFSVEDAARMMQTIHLRQMTFNQDVQPSFHVVAGQTFTLLQNIAILSGFLGAAAVLLGLFLGAGRATFRVMRGKPAASEPEFLSLHLEPQNKPAQFDREGLQRRGESDSGRF